MRSCSRDEQLAPRLKRLWTWGVRRPYSLRSSWVPGTQEIGLILETAKSNKEILARPVRKVPILRGKSICTLFYEDSTRTRTSFELADKIMSADISSISTSGSSLQKGA